LSDEVFRVHSDKQDSIIFSEVDETYAIVGIQWGKTTAGAYWMRERMFAHYNKDSNFIIAAPTYKILQQSTLPAFLSVMDGFGEYKAGNAEFHMNGGGVCYMRTGTEPDSVVGITNVRAIWGDEAGKFSLYFYENLLARASFKAAPKLFTSTPYTMNWLYKNVLKPFKAGTLKDTLVVQAKSCDNPYFPMAEYEKRRLTMDPRRFNALYNGEFEKMHGLVYDCFDDELHVCDAFQLPFGTKYYAGVDWGTTHPFVITVRAITPTGNHYQVSEYYKTGLTIMDMIHVAQKIKQVWGIQMFFCDPAQPGYIEEFNRHGCSAMGAENDIRRGIDLHYSLIKQGKFKIFKGSSPYTLDEVDTYHYSEPKDLGPDDKDKEQNPVDQDNHAMDTWRYATLMTYYSADKKAPHVPGLTKNIETVEARIKRLKTRNNFKRTERFS
jgi:hypothetical protein